LWQRQENKQKKQGSEAASLFPFPLKLMLLVGKLLRSPQLLPAVGCLLTIRNWIAERILKYGTGFLLDGSINIQAIGCVW